MECLHNFSSANVTVFVNVLVPVIVDDIDHSPTLERNNSTELARVVFRNFPEAPGTLFARNYLMRLDSRWRVFYAY